jgi:hypothetical protein
VAVGLIHMSAAPAAARLTVVSLPLTGVINGMWSILLIGLGSWLISGGGASQAAACFLWAHLFSACAVLIALFRRDESVRRELVLVSLPAMAGALLLAALGWLRASGQHTLALSAGMLAATPVLIWGALLSGRGSSESIRRLSFAGIASAVFSRGRGRFRIRSVFAA